MEVLTRIPLVAIALLLVAGPAMGGMASAKAPDRPQLTEAQAKAGFLYNCAIFVVWPSSALSGDDFVIGVLGDSMLSDVVKDMQGQKVNGRTLHVVVVRSLDEMPRMHILFVAGDDSKAVRKMLAQVASAPILTVGEHDSFTRDGGVVRLFTDQGRLRFEINMSRAEDAGLRVSAKMLGLAKIVR